MKQIDILVPCYNEEAVLPQSTKGRAPSSTACGTTPSPSSSSTTQPRPDLPILRQLHEKDARVAYVSLSRNFGKEAAMLAGMDYAEGDAWSSWTPTSRTRRNCCRT